MAERVFRNVMLQCRHDSKLAWQQVNPVLCAGEIGVETDTGKIKVGNGETVWLDLSYLGGESAQTGLFSITVNDVGELVLTIPDGEPPPALSIEDGKLVYTL